VNTPEVATLCLRIWHKGWDKVRLGQHCCLVGAYIQKHAAGRRSFSDWPGSQSLTDSQDYEASSFQRQTESVNPLEFLNPVEFTLRVHIKVCSFPLVLVMADLDLSMQKLYRVFRPSPVVSPNRPPK
jgi:hypothetical protein